MLNQIFKLTQKKQQILAVGVVVPDRTRCVQCGICSYNCPVGIDIRLHSIQDRAVTDSRCITCGECVRRCPRGALHFELNGLIDNPIQGNSK